MKFKIPPSLVKMLSNKYISLVLIIISLTTILMNLYKGNLYPLIIYFLALLFLTGFNDNTNFNLLLSFIIMSIFTSNCAKNGENGGNEGFENKQEQSQQPDKNTSKINKLASITPENETIIKFDEEKKKKNVINYASTVEDAYSMLNKLIGSDGIKNLTSDTQNLMAEQMKLAESMKNIEPLISGFGPILNKAHGLLESIDPKALDNIKSLAKKFSI